MNKQNCPGLHVRTSKVARLLSLKLSVNSQKCLFTRKSLLRFQRYSSFFPKVLCIKLKNILFSYQNDLNRCLDKTEKI